MVSGGSGGADPPERPQGGEPGAGRGAGGERPEEPGGPRPVDALPLRHLSAGSLLLSSAPLSNLIPRPLSPAGPSRSARPLPGARLGVPSGQAAPSCPARPPRARARAAPPARIRLAAGYGRRARRMPPRPAFMPRLSAPGCWGPPPLRASGPAPRAGRCRLAAEPCSRSRGSRPSRILVPAGLPRGDESPTARSSGGPDARSGTWLPERPAWTAGPLIPGSALRPVPRVPAPSESALVVQRLSAAS